MRKATEAFLSLRDNESIENGFELSRAALLRYECILTNKVREFSSFRRKDFSLLFIEFIFSGNT